MIHYCPDCGGGLEYDIISDCMCCAYCGGKFKPDQLNYSESQKKDSVVSVPLSYVKDNYDPSVDGEMMECNMYLCKACGAELVINDVESATFCAYCGQPSIVFDRVSLKKKPKYIIPFKVTKEEAVSRIREKLGKGMFVPNEIKNFKIDVIRGIYVPHYIFDLEYNDDMLIRGKVKSGKNTVTRYFYRKAEAEFKKLSIDGSVQLNDNSTERLEPFNFHEVREFNTAYFSGFYADCADENESSLQAKARYKAKELYEEKVISTVNASSKSIIKQRPKTNIHAMEYIMMPAWFMAFHYEGKPYTIMVNGQTGKVVGAVPSNKTAVATFGGTLCAILAFICGTICQAVGSGITSGNTSSDGVGDFLGFFVMAMICAIGGAANQVKKYKKSVELTGASTINKYAKNRQEET